MPNDMKNGINPKKKISFGDIEKIVENEPNFKAENNITKNF